MPLMRCQRHEVHDIGVEPRSLGSFNSAWFNASNDKLCLKLDIKRKTSVPRRASERSGKRLLRYTQLDEKSPRKATPAQVKPQVIYTLSTLWVAKKYSQMFAINHGV